jgi:hypothetical protein
MRAAFVLLAGFGLYRAAILDRITFYRFVAVVGLCLFLIVVALALEGETLSPGTIVLGVLSAGSGLGAAVALVQYHRTPDPVPGLLRTWFAENQIRERVGIQLVATVAPAVVGPGSAFELRLYLQNTWDGPRRVSVQILALGVVHDDRLANQGARVAKDDIAIDRARSGGPPAVGEAGIQELVGARGVTPHGDRRDCAQSGAVVDEVNVVGVPDDHVLGVFVLLHHIDERAALAD